VASSGTNPHPATATSTASCSYSIKISSSLPFEVPLLAPFSLRRRGGMRYGEAGEGFGVRAISQGFCIIPLPEKHLHGVKAEK